MCIKAVLCLPNLSIYFGSSYFVDSINNSVCYPLLQSAFYKQIDRRMANRKSNFKHYLRGFIITLALLGVCTFFGNLWAIATEETNDLTKSGISDVHDNYIIGAFIMCGVNPLNIIVNIWYNSKRMNGHWCIRHSDKCKWMTRCKTSRDFWFTFSTFIIIITANLLSFNIIYVFMGLIAAPIATGSLLFLYSTVFFLLTMFFTLLSKGWSIAWEQLRAHNTDGKDLQEETDPKPQASNERLFLCCDILIGFLIAVFLVVDMGLYLAFYYEMAVTVEPYSSSAGFLSSFGSLVPAIFTLTAGLLEKRLINFLSNSEDSGRNARVSKEKKPLLSSSEYGATTA